MLHSSEGQQHQLPVNAAQLVKPWSPLSRNRKQLRSVSLRTQEHPSFSMTLAELPNQAQLSTSLSEKFLLCSEDAQQIPLHWLELHKPSPPLLRHGHPSSHHTNHPHCGVKFHYCMEPSESTAKWLLFPRMTGQRHKLV